MSTLYEGFVNLLIFLSIVVGWMFIVKGVALALDDVLYLGLQLMVVGIVMLVWNEHWKHKHKRKGP